MKKLLYFYPHKFSMPTDGIHTRVVSFLEYFRYQGIAVDMISFANPVYGKSYVEKEGLVNQHIYVENPWLQPPARPCFGRSILSRFFARDRRELPDWGLEAASKAVAKQVEAQDYDAILATYAYWGYLAKAAKLVDRNPRLVIDTTDFLTLQQFYGNSRLSARDIGDLFGSELDRMSLFDHVIHISMDEMRLFSDLLPGLSHHFVPLFFPSDNLYKHAESHSKDFDLLFVGSDNPFNVEGLKWFAEKVYPHLPTSCRVAIAGKCSSENRVVGPNVSSLGFVPDLGALFASSKMSICPLQRGTGMKVKVIESLSYGCPVVSTPKGVDGFPNKNPLGGVLVGDNAGAFVKLICKMLEDDDFYQEQCRHARSLFDDSFSKARFKSEMDKIFG